MQFTRVTSESHPLFGEATALYRISFPPHEQRREASRLRILGEDAYHFDLATEDGALIGEILYWVFGNALYIEHFCVLPAMRNRRFGQKILAAIAERYPGKLLILEIDPPKDETSVRRKGFYERCGFLENPYPHVHPPYHRENHGHELVVLSSPRVLTRDEYDAFRRFLTDTVMKNALV